MTTAVETTVEIRDGSLSELPQPRAEGSSITLARALLLVGLLAAPLPLGAVLPWAWGGLTVLAAILLILWGREQVVRRWVKVAWSPLYLPGVLFLFVAAVQFYAGLNMDQTGAREALLKLTTDFLLFILAGQLFAEATKSVWRRLVAAVTIFMFALSVFAILQYFSSGGLIYWTVQTASMCTFGPYANHNHYAGLMEILIPIGVAGVLGRRDHSPLRAFSVFAVVVALASVLLSGSRGGFIALLAEAAILGAILARGWLRQRTRSVWAAVALGAAASATLFFLIDPGQVSKRLATVAEIPTKPEATFAERWLVSRDSTRILADHHWMGIGLGSFPVAYPQYQSFATDLLWDHAHNDYAEALAETGAVGGGLIAAGLSIFLLLAFGQVRERLENEAGWIQMGAAIGCCGLLVHGLGDFNLHIPANAAWFAVCAAISTRQFSPDAAVTVSGG
jgi:O-antigen ligase